MVCLNMRLIAVLVLFSYFMLVVNVNAELDDDDIRVDEINEDDDADFDSDQTKPEIGEKEGNGIIDKLVNQYEKIYAYVQNNFVFVLAVSAIAVYVAKRLFFNTERDPNAGPRYVADPDEPVADIRSDDVLREARIRQQILLDAKTKERVERIREKKLQQEKEAEQFVKTGVREVKEKEKDKKVGGESSSEQVRKKQVDYHDTKVSEAVSREEKMKMKRKDEQMKRDREVMGSGNGNVSGSIGRNPDLPSLTTLPGRKEDSGKGKEKKDEYEEKDVEGDGEFLVVVKATSDPDKSFTFNITKTTTVGELKAMFSEERGFGMERLRMITLGQLLRDDSKSLWELGVRPNVAVHISVKK